MATNHSPADILRYLLIDLDYGVLPTGQTVSSDTWLIFADLEPDRPDNCITVYNTNNIQFGRSQIDGSIFEHEGFQIRIRSATSVIGYRKSAALVEALDNIIYFNTVTIGEDTYCIRSTRRIGDINALGKDTPTPTQRSVYTINGTIVLKQLT